MHINYFVTSDGEDFITILSHVCPAALSFDGYDGYGKNTPVSVIDMKKAANRQPFSSIRSLTAALQQLLQPLTAPENIQISFQAVVGIHSQLAVDVAVVTLHRPHADEQQAGDVLDRIALGIVTALLSA